MSLFRSPGEISSSEEDGLSDGDKSVQEEEPSWFEDEAFADQEGSHDRSSTSFDAVLESKDPEHGIAGFDAESHATMMTTALLEYYCLTRATEVLNAQAGSQGRYTRDSPEVQLLGRRLYAHKSRFLSANGVLAAGVDGDDWEVTRKYYRDSLDLLGLSALEGLDLNSKESRPSTQRSESRVVLSRRPTERISLNRDEPATSKETAATVQQLLSGLDPGFYNALPTPMNFTKALTLQNTGYFPLNNMPGIYQPYRTSLIVSRYTTEFEEESLIGKGSYGVVYKAKHYVDGQFYAIKKVPLNSKRLKQLQESGLQELDHILKEIRTLARLDHSNVVRYYGAWAEYNATAPVPLTHPKPAPRPLGLLSQGSIGEEDSDHGIVFGESTHGADHEESDHGVVFEVTSTSEGPVGEAVSSLGSPDSKGELGGSTNTRKPRRSFVEDYEGEDEDDVESIQRRFSSLEHDPTGTSTTGFDGTIFTDGTGGSHPIQLGLKAAANGMLSPITLHIQMSLHPLSLAKYLCPQSERSDTDSPRHCYRLIPSIKMLLGILSGVEYLHAQGIIHRDLKPANVFLSLPHKQDDTNCPQCAKSGKLSEHYTIPRIGDFGLVADASPCNEEDNGTTTNTPSNQRPVGTEFYRPPVCQCKHNVRGCRRNQLRPNVAEIIDGDAPCGCAHAAAGKFHINESLDVYALGVILFELLYKLDTRMERLMVLSELTCSPNGFSWAKRAASAQESGMQATELTPVLPADFKDKIDLSGIRDEDEGGNNLLVSEKLVSCITRMVEPDSRKRWTCTDVRTCLEEILLLAESR